jgi:hypothetical protein
MTELRPGVPVPPKDLLDQWYYTPDTHTKDNMLSAAEWAADEQLRLCVEWLERKQSSPILAGLMYSAMRPEPPKPPTLKEQAQEVLCGLEKRFDLQCDLSLIRRALETLP